MPYTKTQPALPWQGKTLTSTHCSQQAAVGAAETVEAKCQQYVTWLMAVGGATDWQAHDHFHWPMGTVCSVRNLLVDRGRVKAVGICEGPYKRRITIWAATL